MSMPISPRGWVRLSSVLLVLTFAAAAAVYPRLCGEGKPTEISGEIAAFFGLPEEESGGADAAALAAAYIEKYNALYADN